MKEQSIVIDSGINFTALHFEESHEGWRLTRFRGDSQRGSKVDSGVGMQRGCHMLIEHHPSDRDCGFRREVETISHG